nr:MAG TPA: hypothetical protein [Caudoviricetes sp.]
MVRYIIIFCPLLAIYFLQAYQRRNFAAIVLINL